MGLAESLTKSATTLKLCGIGKILLKLSDQDRDALIGALASEITYRTIELALRKEGHKTSVNSILEHRRKECACYWGAK